jgi:transposase-like protein
MRHPRTLIEFMDIYPTEAACRESIFEHRWPDGFRCSRCLHDKAWPLEAKALLECSGCGYQGSLTAGTVFHRTRTDLRKWFLAIWLLASPKKAPSASELERQLGVTHKTAWLMRRKIQHAMSLRDHEFQLQGIVELDESFIGGKDKRSGLRGRYQPNKTLVAISAEETPSGGLGRVRMEIIDDATTQTLTDVATGAIKAGSTIKTDGYRGYLGLPAAGYQHEPRVQRGAELDEDWMAWAHIVISNFKRWQLDIFHGTSPDHLQAYLDEYCYRLNRRGQRLDLFRRILNRCVLYTDPAPYSLLTST